MAQPITVTIPHKLGKAEARSRIAGGFDQIKDQLGAQSGMMALTRFSQLWDGDRLSFTAQALGQTIAGRIDVHENDVRIEIDLPALLAGFAEKIVGKLRKQGTLLLEKK